MQEHGTHAGAWVFVCGPSGAGKDSLMTWAQHALADDDRIVFARRMVTRSSRPGAADVEVAGPELDALAAKGQLAWHWEANGNRYAVAGHYRDDVAAGRIVVVNGSREHACSLPASPRYRRVLVTAPIEVLAQRLQARGREDAESIRRRLARASTLGPYEGELVIRNDGPLETAGARLADYLRELAACPTIS